MATTLRSSRSSGLRALHPLTKLTLALAVAVVGLLARSSVIPLCLYLLLLVVAIWGRVAGRFLRGSLLVLAPFALSLVLIQGFFFPGASRVLLVIGPLALKAEGLEFALATSARILLLAGSGLILLLSTEPSDLALALTERGLPPALGYVILSAIQLLPQMEDRALAIVEAQRSRGLETEAGLRGRVRALPPLLGPLVTRALADVDERAMALDARGFSIPGKKTAYQELKDSAGQRALRWVILAAGVLLVVGEIGGWLP